MKHLPDTAVAPRTSRRKTAGPDDAQPELPLGETAAISVPELPQVPPLVEPTALDHHFAVLLERMDGGQTAGLHAAALALSAARRAGHTCLPAQDPRLAESCVVGRAGEYQPLLLTEEGALYLHRYWSYEQSLAAQIAARLAQPAQPLTPADEQDLAVAMPPSPDGQPSNEDQRRAAVAALKSRLCFITGGPGTGKTRTVALLVALLQRQAARRGEAMPRLLVAAPTGKAAARLTESLAGVPNPFPDTPAARVEAATVHRALGFSAGSSEPRFHERRPLPYDIVIVDEASMVDLALMAKLFAAVAPKARLIVLGDRYQLASVDAGLVLTHLAQAATARGGEALAEHWRELRVNFRFAGQSILQEITAAVNEGNATKLRPYYERAAHAEFSLQPLPAAEDLPALVQERAMAGYAEMLAAPTPAEALAALNGFRVLCAVRSGPWGVRALNRWCEAGLARAGLLSTAEGNYAGQPIMVTQNDHRLGIFNGDTGLILADPQAGGALRAYFPLPGGGVRQLSVHRLPAYETAWAITVHKSQGSEFQRELLVLPSEDSPVLSRELLYTGLTRARTGVELWANPATLDLAIARRTERHSGLTAAVLQALRRTALQA